MTARTSSFQFRDQVAELLDFGERFLPLGDYLPDFNKRVAFGNGNRAVLHPHIALESQLDDFGRLVHADHRLAVHAKAVTVECRFLKG